MALPVIVTAVTACLEEPDLSEQITSDNQQHASVSTEEFSVSPYYFHGDDKIVLDIRPNEIIIETQSPAEHVTEHITEHIKAVIAGRGIDMVEMRPAEMLPGHWLVELSRATNTATGALVHELRQSPDITFVSHVYQTRDGEHRVIPRNRLVIKVHPGVTAADVQRMNARFGTAIERPPTDAEAGIFWLTYPADRDPLAVAAAVHGHPMIAWVDPDKVSDRQLFAVPTDPLYPDQNYLRSPVFRNGIRVDANAQEAWNLNYGAWAPSAGPLRIAVVDSGIQSSHPDVGNVWGIGYDATTGTWDSWGCTDCATNPAGHIAHGTIIAGIISAPHNNSEGIAGLAPAAQLMAIRIVAANGMFPSDSMIAQGINNAWFNGAHIMNNSWGGGAPSNSITGAINSATTSGRSGRGTVMVFAIGNDFGGPVHYPANLSNVLAVGALDRQGNRANYSNVGSQIDVVAVGGESDFVSTDYTGTRGWSSGDYIFNDNGTSYAAPQAAAVAAMVLARKSTWSESQIRAHIKAGADPWGNSNEFGAGKLNAYRTLVGRISLYISGASIVTAPSTQTYTAHVSGGLGGYTYRWEKLTPGVSGWQFVGSSPTYSEYISQGEDFSLRVTVEDAGTDEHFRTAVRTVIGPVDDDCLHGLLPEPVPCPPQPL